MSDTDTTETAAMIEIPADRLSPDALDGVIDDFILREGTDYGAVEASLEAKRRHVRAQLERGTARIVFDPASETFTLTSVPGRS